MPRFSAAELERFSTALFESAGVPSPEAQIVAGHLVEANLGGHDSHGILRIPQYVDAVRCGRVKLGVRPKILSEADSTLTLDGQLGFGQVAAREAMDLAIGKARRSGISAVTLRNSYHSGRIASYTCQAADAGMIGLVMVNAGGGGQSVAPHGGLERRLATNPISIAAPANEDYPVFLDIATSVAPEGKVRDYFQRGQSVPMGWITDDKGRPTTDPGKFYGVPGGALLPLGGAAGYKGFGLGFMIDVIAGGLSGAGTCRANAPEPRDGLFLMAIDIDRFLPRPLFYDQVAQLIAHVKSCPPAPGFTEVFVPGEVERREEARRRREGIEIDDKTWDLILKTGEEVGVTAPASAELTASFG